MTEKQSKLMIEAIKKLIASEVARQVQNAKVEIYRQVLHEVKKHVQPQPKQAVQSGIKSLYEAAKPQGQNKKIYSTNPMLNEILQQTEMNIQLLEGQEQAITDESGKPLNITAHDSEGRPVNFEKPAVKAVLESMNRRYEGFEEEASKSKPKPVQQQQRPQPAVNPNPSAYLAAMQSIDDDVSNIRIDPLNEEW